MKKEENEILAAQLGDLGGETLSGRKLSSSVTGGISKEEQRGVDEFVKKSRKVSKLNDYDIDAPVISQGWIPIDRKELGLRSQFYPSSWNFFVKPATVEAIKAWSSIDDDRIDNLNMVFNEVMKQCVSIKDGDTPISWNKLNSWDRFWFILKVREYTFSKGEAKVEFEEECPSCGKSVKFVLAPDKLFFEYPDDEVMDKHLQADDRLWYIDPSEYGLEDANPLKLYIPTLEKDAAIFDWALEQARSGKKLDETFVRFLPWMLQKTSRDPQQTAKMIDNVKRIYQSWDMDTFDFMDSVVRNIAVVPTERLVEVCECNEEVTSTVKFQNGIRNLFRSENRFKKFGSK